MQARIGNKQAVVVINSHTVDQSEFCVIAVLDQLVHHLAGEVEIQRRQRHCLVRQQLAGQAAAADGTFSVDPAKVKKAVGAPPAMPEAAALFFLGFIIRQMLTRGADAPSVASTWTHRLMEMVGGTLWIVAFNAAGVSLLLRAGGGLYLLAVVMFIMFAWNIYLAWVLITEVSEAG